MREGGSVKKETGQRVCLTAAGLVLTSAGLVLTPLLVAAVLAVLRPVTPAHGEGDKRPASTNSTSTTVYH